MINHIVMLRIKDFAEGKSKKENLEYMKTLLYSLKEKISGILDLEVGINYKQHEPAFDLALIVKFDSKQDLENYIVHPEHKKIAEYIHKVRTDRAVVDYEI
jgi:hypothetical protein